MSQLVSNTYVLHELLGEGGTGLVYRATNRLARQTVALKQLRSQQSGQPPDRPIRDTVTGNPALGGTGFPFDSRVLLAREFQTLSSLHHPNVIRVFDFGFDERRGPYFTMELLASPRTIIAESRDKSVEEKIGALVQLLRGLVYVHRRNIIHCDLKPSNVLFVDGVVKILDFGIALAKSTKSRSAGTIGYIAPEVLLGGSPTVASDLFAFGVIAYELLAGRFPFDMSGVFSLLRGMLHRTVSNSELEATMVAMAYMALGEGEGDDPTSARMNAPPPLTGLGRFTEPLNRVVMQLLAPKPEERYSSAEAVIDELSAAFNVAFFVDTADTRESFLKAAEFVGREDELERLVDGLKSACAGRGSGWLIGGESGVGKSRLVEELRTLALVQSAQVLRTRATVESARAYQLWSPVLRALLISTGASDDEASVVKDIVVDIATLLDRPVGDAPPLPPALARERLSEVVESILRRHGQPLVILLEDLQWADTDSLALLDVVSRKVADLPILLVGNYRDDERPDLPNMLPRLHRLQLKRLSSESVERLVASMLGSEVASSSLTAFLQKETEGNAFFLIEVVRALADETTRLADVGKVELPERIVTGGMTRIIQRRLDRLPANRLSLLHLAAIAGRQIDQKVLMRASGEHDLGSWLMVCANAAVLEVQDGQWQFMHDKLRDRALAGLSPGETRELHQRIAEALESVHGASVEKQPVLAFHCKRAQLREKAAEYFVKSANESARIGAVVDARKYYVEALEELRALPNTEERRRHRVDVAVKLVTISWYSVPPAETLALMEEARALMESIDVSNWTRADRGRAASISLFHGRGIYALSETGKALQSYRKGLDHAKESGDAALHSLLKVSVGQSLTILGRFNEALPNLEESVDLLAKAGNWLEWSRLSGFLGMTLAGMGRVDEAVALLESAADRTRQLKSSTYLALLHIYPTVVNLWIENWTEMLREARECAQMAIAGKDLGVAGLGLSMWEWAAIRVGDRASADEARESFATIHARLGGSTLDAWHAVAEIDRALAFGPHEEAVPIAERVALQSRERGSVIGEALANRSWARALHQMAQYDEAERRLADSVRISDHAGGFMLSARTHATWAEVCRERGDADGASRHGELAARHLTSTASRWR